MPDLSNSPAIGGSIDFYGPKVLKNEQRGST
jgi:hypothetical protein